MNNPNNALAVQGLNHISLLVCDLDASVRFYGDVLGLPSLPRPDFDFPGAWFALGSQELHLIADPSRWNGLPSFHFALQVEDANAAGGALTACGITDFQGPAPRPDGAVQVFFKDPDGNVIELVSFPATS